MFGILKSPYIIGGVIIFLILFFVGIFALDVSWGESALYSAVLTLIGTVVYWWKNEGL